MSDSRARLTTGEARGAQRGFTLAEILVAIAVFAIVSAIAMTLFIQLQKTFHQGENAAAQQQNTRIAFDRMMADLRMAGYNYNPDGDRTRPDEQIEGMWANAITVRGDYDYETSDANTPESTLGTPSSTFRIVSTGNDEIVTYALGKPNGSGGTSISFVADVIGSPRDGTQETVTINNVWLDMNSPPYTLYRMSLKNGVGSVVNIVDRTPIADNIRRLEITYYDGGGAVLATMAGGSEAAADLAIRQKIAKVGVRVIGMTEDPDLAYFDPADTNPASRHFRKFELASDVTPRNIGFVGVPDLDIQKPSTPTGLALCPGHCRGLVATWNPNPSSEGVVKYLVSVGPSQISQGAPQDAFGTSYYINNLTNGSSYVAGLRAVDAAGNQSDPAAFSSLVTTSNLTTPTAPTDPNNTNMTGGSAKRSQIDVTWARPTMNVNPATGMSCDGGPSAVPLRDLAGYRVWRGATAAFDPNVPAQVQASWDPNQIPGNLASPAVADTSVVNCRNYFYKVAAEDWCGVKSANPPAAPAQPGSATTSTLPKSPMNLVATDMGINQTLLQWNTVTQDTNNLAVLIDTYKVWRAAVPTGNDPNQASYSMLYDGTVPSVGSPAFTDQNRPNIPATQDYWYRVSARDDCPNESALSSPAFMTRCNFGGSIQINLSPGGNPVLGIQTVYVSVTGGVTTTQGQLIISDVVSGAVVFNQTSTSYPYTFTWNTTQSPVIVGHSYNISAAVTSSGGCTETQTTSVSVIGAVACCIAASNPRLSNNTAIGSISGGTKNNEVSFDLVNGCGQNVDIEGLDMDWNNLTTSNPLLAGWTYGTTPTVVFTPVLNPISSGTTPVAKIDLTSAPFTTYSLPSTVTTLNPLAFNLIFDHAMVAKLKGVDVGNTILTEFFFRTSSTGGQGRCTVTVLADPTTPGITLCDPAFNPSCPGF